MAISRNTSLIVNSKDAGLNHYSFKYRLNNDFKKYELNPDF